MEQRNDQPEQAKLIAVSLLVVIAFLGTIGNLLVLKVTFSGKRRRFHEYLFLNLVATDTGTCLVSIPLDIAEQFIGRFPYGAALCRVIYPLQSVLVYVSVMTLLLMSAERFRLIVTPMKPKIEVKTGLITIAVMWILCCLIVLPFSLSLRIIRSKHCHVEWPHVYSGKVFTLIIFILLYIAPLLIMTVLYTFMIRVLYKDSQTVKRSNILLSQASINRRLHRNVKIIKVFVVAVVAFAICMLPTHISWLWHDFGRGSANHELFSKVSTFSNILMYTNSLLNPFIFGSIDVKNLTKLSFKSSGMPSFSTARMLPWF